MTENPVAHITRYAHESAALLIVSQSSARTPSPVSLGKRHRCNASCPWIAAAQWSQISASTAPAGRRLHDLPLGLPAVRPLTSNADANLAGTFAHEPDCRMSCFEEMCQDLGSRGPPKQRVIQSASPPSWLLGCAALLTLASLRICCL